LSGRTVDKKCQSEGIKGGRIVLINSALCGGVTRTCERQSGRPHGGRPNGGHQPPDVTMMGLRMGVGRVRRMAGSSAGG
jgi:hypothetical protein